MKLPRLIFCLLLPFAIAISHAQQDVNITTEDVDRFLKTYKPLIEEFEKLGESYEGIEDPTAFHALSANNEAMSILRKYGWDENFGQKWVYVASAYSMVKMDQEIAEMPADQQEQFKAMMGTQAMPYDVSDEVKGLIKKRMDEFDELFDN